MTARSLLDLSSTVERGIGGGILVLALALVARSFWRSPRETSTSAAWEASLTRRAELGVLALILAVAAALRVVGWNRGLTGPFYFSQTATLFADEILARGTWWHDFAPLFRRYQVALMHESAVMMPVAVAFQRVLGPSIHLPVLIGAFFGTTGVLLAWWLGRAAESRVFGLVFAALVAIAPLQVVWSRNGGVVSGGVPHVLLVVALAFVAGRRGSLGAAVLAGLATWATLYHYYGARIAIGLAPAALLLGVGVPGARLRRSLTALLVFVATLGAIYAIARPPGMLATLWPTYTGYVGNKGEQSLRELVERNLDPVRSQVRSALRAYFWENRVGKAGATALIPGMEAGGLVLVPIGLLGLVGLARCVASPRRRVLWVALAAAALATPALSVTSARRLTVFDLSWCALAAHGTLALLDRRPFRALSPRTAAHLTAAMLTTLGTWSFTTIVLLNRVLPAHFAAVLPFSESGFVDGLVCKGCLQAAYRWQEEIAQERFIVVFDTDLWRENRTMPGGLELYGKLAALAEGKKDNFLNYYAVMLNFDAEPPHVGAVYRPDQPDFASYLITRISAARPASIVWEFAQPTAWERWLADRLEAAGGVRNLLGTPSLRRTRGAAYTRRQGQPVFEDAPPLDDEAFVIVTPREKQEEAFAILRSIAELAKPRGGQCVTLERTEVTRVQGPALALHGASAPHPDAGPDWIVASWGDVRYRDHVIPTANAVGVGYSRDGSEQVHVLAMTGSYLTQDLSRGGLRSGVFPAGHPLGYSCAVNLDGRWWAVDPLSGRAVVEPDTDLPLAPGRWVGVARLSDHELVLASADQELAVFDVARSVETLRFPAPVWPSRRVDFQECSPIVAGDGWIGSYDHFQRTLGLYDRGGTALGTIRLDLPGDQYALQGAGSFLGMGYGSQVETVRLSVKPGCLPLRSAAASP